MNNKILLSEEISDIVYEPHIRRNDALPFIFHIDNVKLRAMANLHENIELLYIIEGAGRVLLGDRCISAHPRQIIAINSFVAHSVSTESGLRYACLIVDTRFLLESGINISTLRLSEAIDDAEAAARFSEIMEEYAREGDFSEAGIRAAVLRLLVHLCRNHSTPNESRGTPDAAAFLSVCTAVEFIKSNFSSPITLDAVAASVGLTKYHFLRKFKRITGLTVLEYINMVRCLHARQLLVGGASVKEAAIRSGFANFSHFSSIFKKYTGALPSEIRNQKSL